MRRFSRINIGLSFVVAFAGCFSACTDNDGPLEAGGAGTSGAVGTAGKTGSAGASHGTAGMGGGASGGESGGAAGASEGGSAGDAAGGSAGDAGFGGAGPAEAAAGMAGTDEAAGAAGTGSSPVGPTGTGADGDITVATATNMATDNSGARSCADGGDAVAYSVTALSASAATLDMAPSAGCLAAGDEVLLINLQGTATASDNVGNYETLKVSGVTSDGVSFTQAKTRFYGDTASDDSNLGVARTNQRVMLQRVPNYASVTVGASASLTGAAWDGVKGGVLFFRAAGTVTIAGTVNMSGKGYAGGSSITTVSTNGQQGESFQGLGSGLQPALNGGGGGGLGDEHGCQSYGTSGGGAAYGAPGASGSDFCSGAGGTAYGEQTLLLKLMLGSGGGSGGTDNYLGDNPPGGYGGNGGGIVVMLAKQLLVSGGVTATGAGGQGDPANYQCDNGGSVTSCWDYSGPGGGGSGGSILFDANTAALGADLVSAAGGIGAYGNPSGIAGDGGVGRIALGSGSSDTSGSTLPAAVIN